MRTVQLLTLLSLAAPALAATELKVDVYEGPTECSDEVKVKSGDHLEMHYTGTIDESSETGVKGSKFDSSRDRDQTFDFQIGQGAVIKGCKYFHHQHLTKYICTYTYLHIQYIITSGLPSNI